MPAYHRGKNRNHKYSEAAIQSQIYERCGGVNSSDKPLSVPHFDGWDFSEMNLA